MIANGGKGALDTLSARQLEVATFVAAGNSSREIAEKLKLSPRTVETHISAIYEKLGVRSRSRLAAMLATTTGVLRAGNVPAAPHPLIGRTADISAVVELLRGNPLVTILGTGGIGKTQASIRVAADFGAEYVDGAWFVEFASLTSGDDIASEIARALRFSQSTSEDAITTLTKRLKNKRLLLVFDSCESVIGPAAKAAATIVRGCPEIAILATSREALGISGEVTYRLPALAPSDARALFIERTQAADHRIVIDDDASRAIDEICRRLDGIPLAIELAAARTNMFAPTQLLQRLESRFALLDGGRRDVLPRHQSMDALIDWSYDQLDDREREVFRRLSIFSGRFSLEAAFAISGMRQDNEASFLNVLSSLIGKSLVVAEPENGELSYRLLETTRLYARRKLAECGEENDVARTHVRYLRDVLASLTRRARIWFGKDAVAFFHREHSDLRAALVWALQSGDVVGGAELLAEIHGLWSLGSLREGIALMDDYLAALGTTHPILRAKLLSWLCELYWRNGDHERATTYGAAAVAAARESADEATLGHALFMSGAVSIIRDRTYAREALDQAEMLAETPEMTRYECRSLRARLTYLGDEYERAIPMYRSLLAEAQELGDTMGESEAIRALALLEYKAGRYDRAVELAREAVAIMRGEKEHWMFALVTLTLACFLVRIGHFHEAAEIARESLALIAEIDSESHIAGVAIEVIGCAAATDGQFVPALKLQGKAHAIAARPGIFRGSAERHVAERFDALLRDVPADVEPETLRALGAELAIEHALALAGSG